MSPGAAACSRTHAACGENCGRRRGPRALCPCTELVLLVRIGIQVEQAAAGRAARIRHARWRNAVMGTVGVITRAADDRRARWAACDRAVSYRPYRACPLPTHAVGVGCRVAQRDKGLRVIVDHELPTVTDQCRRRERHLFRLTADFIPMHLFMRVPETYWYVTTLVT